MTVEESVHVSFDKSNPKSLGKVVDDLADILESMTLEEKKQDEKAKPKESFQPQVSNEPH
jgi:hypothetical protein